MRKNVYDYESEIELCVDKKKRNTFVYIIMYFATVGFFFDCMVFTVKMKCDNPKKKF